MGKLQIIIGAAVGAGAALLLAPKTGAETRALVAGKINEYADGMPQPIQDAAATAKAKVVNATEEVRPTTDDIRVRINEARDRIVEQIARNQQGAKTVDADVVDVEEPAEDLAEKLEQAVEEMAEKVEDTVEEIADSAE